MNEKEVFIRIALAAEHIATALETIAECEVKSVALSNKFADTNENLNSVLNLIKSKPPEVTDDELTEKFRIALAQNKLKKHSD